VATFKDSDEVYAFLGELFRLLVADGELSAQFRAANTILRYDLRKPEAQITCKLLLAEPAQVDLGASALEPEVVMTMDADVAHRFWLGKLNVAIALARGQIKTQGPIAKVLPLASLVKPVVPRYQALLAAAGRPDLL